MGNMVFHVKEMGGDAVSVLQIFNTARVIIMILWIDLEVGRPPKTLADASKLQYSQFGSLVIRPKWSFHQKQLFYRTPPDSSAVPDCIEI